MKNMYKAAAMITLTILAGCGSNDAFENEVKRGNYLKAIDIYEEKLEGNSAAENSSAEFLDSYIQDQLDAYASGKISEESFTNAYTTVEKVNETLQTVSDLPEIERLGKEITGSKESYEDGKRQEEAGNIPEAVNAYRKVSQADTEHYESSVNKANQLLEAYTEDIGNEAEDLAGEGKYDQAIALLEAGMRQIGENSDLIRLMEEISTGKYETLLDQALKENDIAKVIRIYAEAEQNAYVSVSTQMTKGYASAVSAYVKEVQDTAEEIFAKGKDYKGASDSIREAMNQVKEDPAVYAQLQEMIDNYSNYKPVKLQDLGYTSKAKYIQQGPRVSDDARDVTGRQFEQTGVICPKGGSSITQYAKEDKEAEIMYYLNGEYSTLNGTVFRPYSSLAYTEHWEKNTRAEIYGDGVLLYEAPVLTENTYESYDFSVDVTGVRQLKIMVRGMWSEPDTWLGLYIYHPRICLGDLTLQK